MRKRRNALALLMADAIVRATEQPHLRRGQAAFTVLDEQYPSIAGAISGSVSDPFYNDANLKDFWTAVGDRLSDS